MSANSGETTILRPPAYVPGGRSVAAERGWAWIAEGWTLVMRAPLPWILITILSIVILIVLSLFEVIGTMVHIFLTPVFLGGLALGCRSLEQGGKLQVGHLFAGFQTRFKTLAGVGGIYLVATTAIALAVDFAAGGKLSSLLSGPLDLAAIMAAAATLLIALLALAVLMLPVIMAVWFAAALVSLDGKGAPTAMRESFIACLRNTVPFLVYGVVMLVLSVLATIPVFLGWLLLGPVIVASVYTAYRDIYFS